MSIEPHVTLGAEQVGSLLAEWLLGGGKDIRVARRSSGAPPGRPLHAKANCS